MDPEIIIVDNDVHEVSCDGGIPALGHPRVWYSFDSQDKVKCGYCDRIFIKRNSVHSKSTENKESDNSAA